MGLKYVVDTHALGWFLEANSRLGTGARSVLEGPSSELVLPIIALAEACWLIEHGRTSIPTVSNLLHTIDRDPRIVLHPLDRDVVDKTTAMIGNWRDA